MTGNEWYILFRKIGELKVQSILEKKLFIIFLPELAQLVTYMKMFSVRLILVVNRLNISFYGHISQLYEYSSRY